MPATVRVSATDLVTTVRLRDFSRRWIAVSERYPVDGIGEDTPHRVGRFGVSYR
jgi:hypothetical protein